MVVEPHDHAAEARVMRHVLRLYSIERQLPSRSVLGRERGDAAHRITNGSLVPRRERERAVDRRDVVGIRAVLHLRLESFTLVAEFLENGRGAVRKGKWTGKDLDHRPSTRHADRLQ